MVGRPRGNDLDAPGSWCCAGLTTVREAERERPRSGRERDVQALRLQDRETGWTRFAFGTPFWCTLRFSNLWVTAILHQFRRLERHTSERSRIEIRTFVSECYQNLTCHGLALASLGNDCSSKHAGLSSNKLLRRC